MTPGYNPSGFEPNAHERFDAPDPEVIKTYQDVFKRKIESFNTGKLNVPYKEAMEYRRQRPIGKVWPFPLSK